MRTTATLALALCAVMASSVLAAPAAPTQTIFRPRQATAPTQNIIELAESVPDLSLLVKLVSAAGLVNTLESGNWTVFAPTNEAFERLGRATLERLLQPENKDELAKILTFHVHAGEVLSSQLSNNEDISTVEGGSLRAFIRSSEVLIEGGHVLAVVEKADVLATNGALHVINRVLIPSGPAVAAEEEETKKTLPTVAEIVASNPALYTLNSALSSVPNSLNGTGPFTLFAPTNKAFGEVLDIVAYLEQGFLSQRLVYVLGRHLLEDYIESSFITDNKQVQPVAGGPLQFTVFNDTIAIALSTITTADIKASNGVVHIVDRVIN